MYGLLLASTAAWAWLRPLPISHVLSSVTPLFIQLLQGIYLGLAIAGILPFLNLLLTEKKRFPVITFAAAGSSVYLRVGVVLTLVLAEEAWRAVVLRSLMSDRYSGPAALAITSAVYAAAYSIFGIRSAQGKAITGAVFGAVYLSQRSFLTVCMTHLAFESEWLWLVTSAAPNATPPDVAKARCPKCPACGFRIDRSNLRTDGFRCPSCGDKLSVADSRASFIRWASVLGGMPLLLGTLALFPTLQSFWVICAIMCGVELSLLILLQSAFPPKLQWGEPNFVGLCLTDHAAKPDAGTGPVSEDSQSVKRPR